MAIAALTIWEVRTTGNDTNGGGFVAGSSGVDWSQQDAAQYSVADGVTAGTTTITSATANFGTDVVGNIMYVQGGTGGVVAGWYEIMSRTNATTIVVDRSTGLTAGTGVTFKIGGSLATPGRAVGSLLMQPGNDVWVRAGTYVLTTTVAGPAGPLVYNNSYGGSMSVRGYDRVRGDGGKFTLDAGVLTGITLVDPTNGQGLSGGGENFIGNCVLRGNGNATVYGTFIYGYAIDCEAYGCVTGFRCVRATGCYAYGCGTGIGSEQAMFCVVEATTGSYGFTGAAYCCLAIGGTNGFLCGNVNHGWFNCTASGCSGAGFLKNGTVEVYLRNCLATACGTGFDFSTSMAILDRVAGYGNTVNLNLAAGGVSLNPFVFCGVDPFVNSAGKDFRLNNLEFGGALLRGKAVGTHGQVSIRDIGAVQTAGGWEPRAVHAWNAANLTHVFAVAGDYAVRIDGGFPAFNHDGGAQKAHVVSVGGTWAPVTLLNAFRGCSNLVEAAVSKWDLSGVSVASGAFQGCALNVASVDAILAQCVTGAQTNVPLDLDGGTNAAPSATGLASKAVLVSRGWTVTHN